MQTDTDEIADGIRSAQLRPTTSVIMRGSSSGGDGATALRDFATAYENRPTA